MWGCNRHDSGMKNSNTQRNTYLCYRTDINLIVYKANTNCRHRVVKRQTEYMCTEENKPESSFSPAITVGQVYAPFNLLRICPINGSVWSRVLCLHPGPCPFPNSLFVSFYMIGQFRNEADDVCLVGRNWSSCRASCNYNYCTKGLLSKARYKYRWRAETIRDPRQTGHQCQEDNGRTEAFGSLYTGKLSSQFNSRHFRRRDREHILKCVKKLKKKEK